jgi:DNA (cytosine-5)-methyltransferase 1
MPRGPKPTVRYWRSRKAYECLIGEDRHFLARDPDGAPIRSTSLPVSSGIRHHRQKKKVQLRELARKAGVQLGKLSKWERGLERPSDTELASLATVLGCEASTLRAGQDAIEAEAVIGEGYATALPEITEKVIRRREQPTRGRWKVLDLFCGCGGFSYGLEQTGHFDVTCGIDLLPDRIDTFTANHPTASGIIADIRNFHVERLAEEALQPDIVIGGPPCQGFSSIRPYRTLTEGDPRNNLIENYLLVVERIKPRWLVLENVVGLLTHAKGEVLEQAVAAFKEAGYAVEWRVLNAANYGLPQNRERLVIVGSLDGAEFPWPEPTHYSDHRSMAGKHRNGPNGPSLFTPELHPAVSVMQAIHDLPEVDAGCSADEYKKGVKLTDYEREMREGSTGLAMHEATDHSEKMMRIIRLAGSSRAALPEGLTTSGFSSSYSRLEPDSPSVTLTVNFTHPASNKCIHPVQHRALTLREGARLQGFPDRFVFCGKRSELSKQIGNAVPPVLGRVIGEALASALLSRSAQATPSRGNSSRSRGVGSVRC